MGKRHQVAQTPTKEKAERAARILLHSLLLVLSPNVLGIALHGLLLLCRAVATSKLLGDVLALTSLVLAILSIWLGMRQHRSLKRLSYCQSRDCPEDRLSLQMPWGRLGDLSYRASLPPPRYPSAVIRRPLERAIPYVAALLILAWMAALHHQGKLFSQNFAISVALVTPLFLFTLRRSALRSQSWRKLSDVWLKWGGITMLSVGGFGFIGLTDAWKLKLLALALSHSQMPLGVLSLVYISVIAALGFAQLLTMLGKAQTQSDEGREPLPFFVAAFAMAWIGDLGLSVLFANSVILTIWAHVGG